MNKSLILNSKFELNKEIISEIVDLKNVCKFITSTNNFMLSIAKHIGKEPVETIGIMSDA